MKTVWHGEDSECVGPVFGRDLWKEEKEGRERKRCPSARAGYYPG